MGKNHSLKVFIVLISAVFMLFAGCGSKPSRKQQTLINSFETLPSDVSIGDYDLETNGYVNLEQFKKYASQGKFSAKATFSIPADFLTTTQAARAKEWISSVTMGINTLTKLKTTDWTGFKKFDVDVYVDNVVVPDLNIKIVDASGKQYLATRPLKSGRNKLEIILEEVYTARIDLQNITSFSLYMDTKGQTKDVILYLDNFRLMP